MRILKNGMLQTVYFLFFNAMMWVRFRFSERQRGGVRGLLCCVIYITTIYGTPLRLTPRQERREAASEGRRGPFLRERDRGGSGVGAPPRLRLPVSPIVFCVRFFSSKFVVTRIIARARSA